MSHSEPKIPLQNIAIVIVNYNGGEFLEGCLKSLAGQTRSPDRVVLVDNHSDSFSADRATACLPGIEIRELEQNIGFAAANNLAIRDLEGIDWVILLNPDTYAEPDWLEKFLDGAGAHPDYQFFGCRMLATKPDTLDGTGDVYHVSGANWRRDYGKPADRNKQAGEIFAPSAAAALYRRDQYLEAGALNEDFFCYMEDVDLGFRMRLLGYRAFYIPEAVVTHHGAALTGQYSDFQIYHGHRNIVWVYLMNMPSYWLWIYMPQHLMYNLASIIRFFLLGKPKPILRAKLDALKSLRRVWGMRRKVQASRRVEVDKLRQVMAHGLLSPYLNRYE